MLLHSALDKEEEKKKLDPFQETLKQIIGRSGGVVHAKHLDRLLRLLDDSNNTHKRLVMLTVRAPFMLASLLTSARISNSLILWGNGVRCLQICTVLGSACADYIRHWFLV